jgi:hypothetical protein
MNGKFKSLIMGGLVVGSLALSATSVLARDYWHWSENQHRWDRRADLRSDYGDLAQAKRQLEYDRTHHANRRVIARDMERIRDIENDIREDRRAFNNRR